MEVKQTVTTTFVGAGGCGIGQLVNLITTIAKKDKSKLNTMSFIAIDTSDASFKTLDPFGDLVMRIKVKGGEKNIDEGSGGNPAAYSAVIKEQLPDIYNKMKPSTNMVLLCGGSSGSGRTIIGHLASYIADPDRVPKPHIFSVGMVFSTASLREIGAVRDAISAFNNLGMRLGISIPYYREFNDKGWSSADDGICHFCMTMAHIFGDIQGLDGADKRAWLHGGHMPPGAYHINPASDTGKYGSLKEPKSVLTLATGKEQPTTLTPTPLWQKVGFDTPENLDGIIDVSKTGGVLHMVVCDSVADDYAILETLYKDVKSENNMSTGGGTKKAFSDAGF